MRSIGSMVAATTLTLAACGQPAQEPAAPAATAAGDPQPSETMRDAFANCQWGKIEGSGLAIWSYACGADAGNVRLVADADLPGFAIEGTADGVTSRTPAIIVFKKAATAPIETILPAVQARSPSAGTAGCTLQPVTYDGAAPGSYVLAPVGAVKARWDAYASGEADSEGMEPPCGDLGPQMSGDRSFRILTDDPTTVVFIEYGSEIQIFDPTTLVSTTPAA